MKMLAPMPTARLLSSLAFTPRGTLLTSAFPGTLFWLA
jgi:hypothetical protein